MFAGLALTPLSVNTAPAATSCGVKDRSEPSIMPAAAGSGPKSRNSPMHTGVAPLSQTSIWAYRADTLGRLPFPELGPSGTYMGLPGSRAMLRAVEIACQSPCWVASEIWALAEELALSTVIPIPSRLRTWPRSTVSVSGQELVHQEVAASPS